MHNFGILSSRVEMHLYQSFIFNIFCNLVKFFFLLQDILTSFPGPPKLIFLNTNFT